MDEQNTQNNLASNGAVSPQPMASGTVPVSSQPSASVPPVAPVAPVSPVEPVAPSIPVAPAASSPMAPEMTFAQNEAPLAGTNMPLSSNPLNTGMGNPVPTQVPSVSPENPVPTQIPVSMMAQREGASSPVVQNEPVSALSNAEMNVSEMQNPENVASNKKKWIIVGVLSVLAVALVSGILFMIFSGDEGSVSTPSNKLGSEESAPPSVVSPFSDEESTSESSMADAIEETLSEDLPVEGEISAPELNEVVESLEESAPPALNLIEESEAESDVIENAETPSESVPVKRVTR